MTLKQLLEAKYQGTPTKLAFCVIGNSRGHNYQNKGVFTTQEIAEYVKIEDEEDRIEFAEQQNPSLRHAFEILLDHNVSNMMTSVSKTGKWVGNFEEEVIGVSAKGPKHAKQLAVNAWSNFDDDEEDDWF